MIKTTLVQIYKALLASPFLATITILVEPLRKLVDGESDFVVILIFIILIDLLVGIMKHLKLKGFSFKMMLIGLVIKVAVTYFGLVIFLAFATLDDGWVAEWFTLVGKFTVLLYPAGSAFANMYTLTDGRFPPISFMRRLKSFDEIITPISSELMKDKKKSNN